MRWVLTSLDMNLVLIPQVSVTLTSQSLIFILDNRGSKWYMVWKPQLTVFQSNNLFPCILSAQLLSLSSICVPSAVLSWILIFYFVENLLMTLCRIVAVCSFLILFLSWQSFNKLRFGFTWLTSLSYLVADFSQIFSWAGFGTSFNFALVTPTTSQYRAN
jgi:hypothetical protein